jgi:hypothetical protein
VICEKAILIEKYCLSYRKGLQKHKLIMLIERQPEVPFPFCDKFPENCTCAKLISILTKKSNSYYPIPDAKGANQEVCDKEKTAMNNEGAALMGEGATLNSKEGALNSKNVVSKGKEGAQDSEEVTKSKETNCKAPISFKREASSWPL